MVNGRVTTLLGLRGNLRAVAGAMLPIFIVDRSAVDAAAELIAALGEDAVLEAADRAARSRKAGNVQMFCRWRQIERLIDTLSCDEAFGTVH
jgi:hypothetical protein